MPSDDIFFSSLKYEFRQNVMNETCRYFSYCLIMSRLSIKKQIEINISSQVRIAIKVHMFWEGHKNLLNKNVKTNFCGLFSKLKFIYSEKATKFCEIFTLLLSYVVSVKSTVKILQNFWAFSEYMNLKGSSMFFYPDFILILS